MATVSGKTLHHHLSIMIITMLLQEIGTKYLVIGQTLPSSSSNLTTSETPFSDGVTTTGPPGQSVTISYDTQLLLTHINIYDKCEVQTNPSEGPVRGPRGGRSRRMEVKTQTDDEIPAWVQITDLPQNCITNSSDNGVTILHGSSKHTCRLLVTSSDDYDTIMDVMHDDRVQSELVVIVELLGNLGDENDRYVMINEPVHSCNISIHHNQFTLTVRGNGSIALTQDRGMQLSFSEQSVSSTSSCNLVRYSEAILCRENNDTCSWPQICTLKFKSICEATLGSSEVQFHCDKSLPQNATDLIFYLDYMDELNLQENNIIRILEGAFLKMSYLTTLYLAENKLRILTSSVFQGLDILETLDISFNQLYHLEGTVFNHLPHLKILNIAANKLTELENTLFSALGELTDLNLATNGIAEISEGAFYYVTKLMRLNLEKNNLADLPSNLFSTTTQLYWLNFADNNLSTFPDEIFVNLTHLHWLNLNHNLFRGLKPIWFKTLYNLGVLHGRDNSITHLDKEMFQNLNKLLKINLPNNLLTEVDFNSFENMSDLFLISFQNNQLQSIHNLGPIPSSQTFLLARNPLTKLEKDSMKHLSNDIFLSVSQPEICACYVTSNLTCTAADVRSPYLTCERLLSDRVIVVFMWTIGVNALVGNILVLILKLRSESKSKSKVQEMFLGNLAVADLLMGIYMIILASADIYFGEYFPLQSENWRSGITCRVAGALSIISSEASVFFVMLTSINRFIGIRFPFSIIQFNRRTASVAITLTWLFALTLGILPSTLAGLDYKFYDNSHVCVGLPLTLIPMYTTERIYHESQGLGEQRPVMRTNFEGNVTGTYFSSALFLGLNCICYLVIVACYIEILRAVKKSSKRSGRSDDVRQEMQLITKVAAIVVTDFLCWFPIIVLGILVQLRLASLPPHVFAWMMSVVLPINSAINPYLYTIADIIAKYKKEHDENTRSSDVNEINVVSSKSKN